MGRALGPKKGGQRAGAQLTSLLINRRDIQRRKHHSHFALITGRRWGAEKTA